MFLTALLNSPNLYWLLLMLAAVIVAFIGVGLYLIRSKQAGHMLEDLEKLRHSMNEVQGRSMEHLNYVSGQLRHSSLPKLDQSFQALELRSKQQFDGSYLEDPAALIAAVQNEDSYQKLHSPVALAPAIVGLLLTVALIFIQGLIDGQNALMLSSSCFPFILGLLFFYLLHTLSASSRDRIDFSAHRMLEQLKTVLPVYSDEAAASLLVERFVSYNDRLSQSAKDLVAEEVIRGVSEHMDTLLQRDLVPSLTKSSETIAALAQQLSEKQENGMSVLADEFSRQLRDRLTEHFDSLGAQFSAYSTIMAESQERVGESLNQFTEHRNSLDAVTAEVKSSLEAMQAERNAWQAERESQAQGLQRLADTAVSLSQEQNTAAAKLASHVMDLDSRLDQFLTQSTASIEELARIHHNLEKIHGESKEENSNTIRDYRVLNAEIKTAAKHMEAANKLLTEKIHDLNESLSNSVGLFKEQVQDQVHTTLDDFDKGLAEMSLRLSHSVTEIRDASNAILRQPES